MRAQYHPCLPLTDVADGPVIDEELVVGVITMLPRKAGRKRRGAKRRERAIRHLVFLLVAVEVEANSSIHSPHPAPLDHGRIINAWCAFDLPVFSHG